MLAMKLTNMFYSICTEDGKETSNSDAPENNPQYTTVYVGNLAPEVRAFLVFFNFNFTFRTIPFHQLLFDWKVCKLIIFEVHYLYWRCQILHYLYHLVCSPYLFWLLCILVRYVLNSAAIPVAILFIMTFSNPQVTQLDLHRHFHALGAGVMEEVRVQRDKGFGFVRYSTHAEAALAIQMGNAQSLLCGKQIKVWISLNFWCCCYLLCNFFMVRFVMGHGFYCSHTFLALRLLRKLENILSCSDSFLSFGAGWNC